MPPLDGEQLGAEAQELAAELRAEEAPPPPGGEPQPEPQPEPEYVPNPAPKIAATFKALRGNQVVAKFVPPRVLAVFDDPTCDQIGDALGPLMLKHAGTLTPQLDAFMQKWGVEVNALWILGSVGWNVYCAMQADPDAARAAAARDVGSGSAAPGGDVHRDPPPKTDGPMVEPS